MRRLPVAAVLFGLIGMLPLLACAAGAVALPADRAAAYRSALIAVAAITLAAHGAVHWGFALAGAGTRRTLQLGFGMLPALAAWVVLLLQGVFGPWVALWLLLAGFGGALAGEWRLQGLGLMPRGYLTLRLVLGGAAIVALAIVLAAPIVGRILRI